MKKILSTLALVAILLGLNACQSECPDIEPTPPPTPTPTPTPTPGEDSTYILPYLRWWDGGDGIQAFESARGSKQVSYDPSFDLYVYSTGNELQPTISYIVGMYAQVDMSSEVLTSPSFYAFMKENGFEPTGEPQNSMQYFTSSKYKQTVVYSVVEPIDLGDGNTMPTALVFAMKTPELTSVPSPMLNWQASPDEVKAFEVQAGFKGPKESTVSDGAIQRYQYSKKTETDEFTELFIRLYDFKDGKLIKATSIAIPNDYIYQVNGDAINPYQYFIDMIKKDGYTSRKGDNGRQVYDNEAKGNKFTFETWSNIKVNGFTMKGAGMAFVPFDGPDEIDY